MKFDETHPPVRTRVPRALHELLLREAAANERTIHQQVRYVLRRWAENVGT
jgi:hypothetical protein